MKQYLVLDFGGTFTKYALMDEAGTFLQQGKVPSACDTLEHMLQSIKPIKEMFFGQYEGVAVSMPGRIDTAAGIAHTGGYFTFIKDTPVGPSLTELLGKPVTVANDGKCAANAEAWNGALADVQDGVVIVLGTGTGGGVVLGGQVRLGHTFGAGEFSALGANFDKLADGVSTIGEGMGVLWAGCASASGLLRCYHRLKPETEVSDGIGFFRVYDAGEPEAHAALEAFGRGVAAGIYSIQAVLDVQRFAIGGGISARTEITDAICKAVDRQFAVIPFTPFSKPEIVRCRYGNDANLVGALAFHLKNH